MVLGSLMGCATSPPAKRPRAAIPSSESSEEQGVGGGSGTAASVFEGERSNKPVSPARVNREVSGTDPSDFGRAVARYRQLAAQGWTETTCTDAARAFEDVADNSAKLVEARYNAGVAYANCAMWTQADKAYRSALDVSASYAPALANLGEVYHRQGNVGMAQQFYVRAIAADPKMVSARINLAQIFRERVKLGDKAAAEEALGHLRRALAVDSDSMGAYTALALVFYDAAADDPSKLDLAALVCEQAKRINDKHAPIYNMLGLIWLKKRNVTTALAYFKRAVALDRRLVEAQMNIGAITLSFRDYATAEGSFRAVLGDEPKNCEAMVGLGVALRGQRRLDDAEKLYERADKCAANNPALQAGVAYNLGVLYQDYKSGSAADLKRAVSFFEEYLRRGGGARDKAEDARRRIGNIQEILQAQAEAKSIEEESRRQQPKGPAPTPDGPQGK